MVKLTQVTDGLTLYAENEILPTFEGVQLWAASAALVLLHQRMGLILAALLESKAVTMLGLVDDKGMIDIDAAIEAAKTNVKKNGKLKVELGMFGELKFDESDFEKLREYITESKVQ